MTSLAKQIRIHAWRSRTETVAALVAALDGMAAVFREPDYAVFRPLYELKAATAKSYAALAGDDLGAASASLKLADSLALQLNYGRAALTIKVLRAVVAHQRGDVKALALLSEATSLAAIGGIERLLAETHPLAETMAKMGQAGAATSPLAGVKLAEVARDIRPGPSAPRRTVIPLGGMLTPKEAEVLRLLTAGMSNKLIAKSMDISDETVKWHLKNLFSKLSAGTRKHAVDRARLLGLIAA
jgi:LuxR family maltose regulon positive regulatory protein